MFKTNYIWPQWSCSNCFADVKSIKNTITYIIYLTYETHFQEVFKSTNTVRLLTCFIVL